MLTLSAAGFALTAFWLHPGRRLRKKLGATLGLILVAGSLCFLESKLSSSWDLSENKRNSFSAVDDATLRQVSQPLRLTVFLAPEDPRLSDLEQNVLKKLRRVLVNRLDVQYVSGSQSGLFASTEDHYGEIWYEMGGQKIVDRSTIEEVVLDQIYQLAGLKVPDRSDANSFPGYPLAAQPKKAALVFYLIWPVVVGLGWWLLRR
jgi:hypothetical protein